MSEIGVVTSQNVSINFKLASVGERIFALLLDLLVFVAYIFAMQFLLFKVFKAEQYFSTLDQYSVMGIFGLLGLPILFYTLIAESLMEGQSIGKKIMGIKVIKIDGYQCSFADYLSRWIFRGPEIFMMSGIPALLSIILSKNNQRLGDMVSGTAVISLKNKVNISHTILVNLAEDYVPRFPGVMALSDNDIRIIKENYLKSLKTKDYIIWQKLADKIQEILKIEVDPKEFSNKDFIVKIIKDYNFYTGKEL